MSFRLPVQAAIHAVRTIQARRILLTCFSEHGSQIVGYLLGYEGDRNDFRVWHIGVEEKHKRRGVGRALIQKCEEICRGRKHSVLNVTTYNRFRGMLILLLEEEFYIEGMTWIKGATEARLLLRKEIR